jgi:hypothetical protein
MQPSVLCSCLFDIPYSYPRSLFEIIPFPLPCSFARYSFMCLIFITYVYFLLLYYISISHSFCHTHLTCHLTPTLGINLYPLWLSITIVFPLLYLPKVIVFSVHPCYMSLFPLNVQGSNMYSICPQPLCFIVCVLSLADVNVGDFLHYSYHFSTAFHCICVTLLLIL